MAKAKNIERVGFDPIAIAHDLGIRSKHAYLAGFLSVLVSLGAWLLSRARTADDKAQSERWGIFIGHWAPTFFGIGLALKAEE